MTEEERNSQELNRLLTDAAVVTVSTLVCALVRIGITMLAKKLSRKE